MLYRYFSLVLFLIFLLNAVISHGAEGARVWKIDKNSEQYYFSYEENGKYIVNKIKIPQNKLQEILETKIFLSEKDAEAFIGSQKNLKAADSSRLSFSKIQTEVPGKTVWPTLNEWSWEWEQKYAEWIITNFNADFFVKYNMKTDCADVAIALRWIFARIHFLPAAQTTVITNRIFSNESVRSEWQNLPTSENWYEDQKFLRALEFILENTYTHSLWLDSYPVLIDKTSLLMGTHLLKLRDSGGHTLVLSEYVKNKSLYTLSSDVPRKVRKLDRYGFWQEFQPKYAEVGASRVGGFVRMRWPLRTSEGFGLFPREEMPFYSLEQYAPDFVTNSMNDFSYEVHKRFGDEATPLDRYHSAVSRLLTAFESRVTIVEDGFEFCSLNDCSEGNANYENHSTPSRDGKISEAIVSIRNLISTFGEASPEMVQEWDAQQAQAVVTIQGQTLTLADLLSIWDGSFYSSDPRVPVLNRWGLSPALSFRK